MKLQELAKSLGTSTDGSQTDSSRMGSCRKGAFDRWKMGFGRGLEGLSKGVGSGGSLTGSGSVSDTSREGDEVVYCTEMLISSKLCVFRKFWDNFLNNFKKLDSNL